MGGGVFGVAVESGAVTAPYAARRLGRSASWARTKIRDLVADGRLVKGGVMETGATRFWVRPLPRSWNCTPVDATVAVLYDCGSEARCGVRLFHLQKPCFRPSGHTGRHYAAEVEKVVAVWD